MIFRRLLLALCAAAAFASASMVLVVALAFTLYALAEPRLGRAGAAATVAFATVMLMFVAGLSVGLANRRAKPAAIASGSALEKAYAFVTQKPIVAAAAAVGMGLMATRNPKYLGEALRSFFEGKPAK